MAIYGFNFRATSGYVTDATNDTYAIGDAYPQTRNGITFGWTTSLTNLRARDRNSSANAKQAGTQFNDNDLSDFQVDLPSSGSWKIRIAMGDVLYGSTSSYVKVYDNTTQLISIEHSGSTTNVQWYDATDVLRTSNADWVNNNAQSTQTFATTTCVVRLLPSASQWGNLAHLELESSAAGGVIIPILQRQYRARRA